MTRRGWVLCARIPRIQIVTQMPRLLVTGARGFIGRHLCAAALTRGWQVRAVVRQPTPANEPGPGASEDVEWVPCGQLTAQTDWRPLLDGVDAVVHLAWRAHVLDPRQVKALEASHADAIRAAHQLALAMRSAGVPRLVFVSTVHIHGSVSHESAISEVSPPAPHNAYARAKWEAEAQLRALCADQPELVVVRPALVYGPGVKGNLLRLLRWLERGLPLPLAGVRNRRSVVGVVNLCDLLLRCAAEPTAAGETFLAADEAPISTPALVRALAEGLGRPARLVWAPPRLMGSVLGLLGCREQWEQLADSLVIDGSRSRAFFPRTDPVETMEGLIATARWYRDGSQERHER
jgi:UDP-glucose 4-epimerase